MRPGVHRNAQGSDHVLEHLGRHVLAKRRDVLNALRADLRGINGPFVVFDRFREAQSEVTDPAPSVSRHGIQDG